MKLGGAHIEDKESGEAGTLVIGSSETLMDHTQCLLKKPTVTIYYLHYIVPALGTELHHSITYNIHQKITRYL